MTEPELIHLIGESKLYALRAALRETFKNESIDDLTLVQGGLSGSEVFRLSAAGGGFIVKVLTKVTILNDPERQFACMLVAARLGLAPEVLFANADAGIAITRFVQSEPITAELRASDSFGEMLANLLRTLHANRDFPQFVEVYDVIDSLVRSLELQLGPFPETIEQYFTFIRPLRQVLSGSAQLASCHNDLNPRNLLYDGDRLWIVDWEAASLGDPELDLATAINFLFFSHTKEERFLESYFGRAPTELERARLFLLKQISFCCYGLTFINGAVRSGVSMISEEQIKGLLSYDKAMKQIGSGLMRLSLPSDMMRLGFIMMRESFQQVITPRFDAALRLLTTMELGRGSWNLKE